MKINTLLAGSAALAFAAGAILLPSFAAAAERHDDGSHSGGGHRGAVHAGVSHHNGGYHGRYAHGGGNYYAGPVYYGTNSYGGGYYGRCGPIPNVLGFCVPLPLGL
jgi:hypothetical protein